MKHIILFLDNTTIGNLIIILLIMFIIFLVFGDILKKSTAFKFSKPIIKTELRCVECGFKYLRDFKEGDYISKEVDEKCRRCGGTLKIFNIYAIETKKSR